jgi:hypothetical protein
MYCTDVELFFALTINCMLHKWENVSALVTKFCIAQIYRYVSALAVSLCAATKMPQGNEEEGQEVYCHLSAFFCIVVMSLCELVVSQVDVAFCSLLYMSI